MATVRAVVAVPHRSLKTLSYSRLSSHDSCARRFWHAYVDHTKPDGFERVEGWMGSRVHETLEWALKRTMARTVPDPVEILEHYEKRWDNQFAQDNVLVVKEGRRVEQYRAIGRQCLSSHLDEHWPFLKHEPTAVEERVQFDVPVGGGVSRFLGYVDRIDHSQDGSTVRIVDYKTGAWVPDFKKPADARQLALYWHALSARLPGSPSGLLVWYYLQKSRTVRIEATPEIVEPAVAWVESKSEQIQSTLEADESADAFPTQPGPLCRWCDFGYVCADNPFAGVAAAPASPPRNARLSEFGH